MAGLFRYRKRPGSAAFGIRSSGREAAAAGLPLFNFYGAVMSVKKLGKYALNEMNRHTQFALSGLEAPTATGDRSVPVGKSVINISDPNSAKLLEEAKHAEGFGCPVGSVFLENESCLGESPSHGTEFLNWQPEASSSHTKKKRKSSAALADEEEQQSEEMQEVELPIKTKKKKKKKKRKKMDEEEEEEMDTSSGERKEKKKTRPERLDLEQQLADYPQFSFKFY